MSAMGGTTEKRVAIDFVVRVLPGALPRQVLAEQAYTVYVVGDAVELGAWETQHAVALERCAGTEEQDAHQWQGRVELASTQGAPVEYKYIVKRSDGHVACWETIPGNRIAHVAKAFGTNVARAKAARQSSTHVSSRMPSPGPREAALGNNGEVNGYREWRCCRTEKEANPWWEVDLGAVVPIHSCLLWKGLSYHELPKHPHARPAMSAALSMSSSSSSSPAPPVYCFISSEPLPTGPDALAQTLALTEQPNAVVAAHQVPMEHDNRVEMLDLAAKASAGRYVRIQHASRSSVLQFAELQVFSESKASASECPMKVLRQEDGLFGIDPSLEAELKLYVDSEWLDPSCATAQVRFWAGSFQEAHPTVQWLDGQDHGSRVALEMRYERKAPERDDATGEPTAKKQRTALLSSSAAKSSKWCNLPVDARGSALLDRHNTDMRNEMEQHGSIDPKRFLNNFDSVDVKTEVARSGAWLSILHLASKVAPDVLEQLQQRVVTKQFKQGDRIVAYGEHQRSVWYLRTGHLDLSGPSSSKGVEKLHTIQSPQVWNERALFNRFAAQSATITVASEQATCEELPVLALLEVLGEEKYRELRTEIVKELYVENQYADDREEGNDATVSHYCDATHAQVFRINVPLDALSTGHQDVLCHRMAFDVFECVESSDKPGVLMKRSLVGTAHLLASQLSAHGEGFLTLPLMNHLTQDNHCAERNAIVGQLKLSYLVMKPLTHPGNSLAHSWRSYWRERPPLNVGHRGLGRSFHQVHGYRNALVRENTLASFILAGRSGADYVEFDVQLTKEQVPVLYHDFFLNVGLEDKRAWTHGSGSEEYQIGIHEMTLRHLNRCHTKPIDRHSKPRQLKDRMKKHWKHIVKKRRRVPDVASSPVLAGSPLSATTSNDGVQSDGGGASPPSDSSTPDENEHPDDEHLVDFFPKLEDLLKHVPPEVGLNVEIKYPDDYKRTALRFSPPFEMNTYVDAILKCIFDHAGSRRIFFSCFDPNICVMLRAKQARYPVFLLTYGRTATELVDARVSLQFAVNFVQMEKLMGIVSNSDSFLENPQWVGFVKRKDVVLMTWGDHNTSHECVQLQKRHAIDAVISDNIGDLIREDQRLRSSPRPQDSKEEATKEEATPVES